METRIPDHSTFGIGFDPRDRGRLHELWDSIIDAQRWSEGPLTERFEALWSEHCGGAPSVAFGSWTGGALAALTYAGVKGQKVICPSNTFMATPLAIQAAGGEPVFVDCRRDDLCASYEAIEQAIAEHRPRAVFLVHIGGHLAFDTERIAALCRAEGVFLLEDCAHAHGASLHGGRAGTFGDAGVYSFYATKTISTGEGGMLVTKDPALAEFARGFRNYGKPAHESFGLNFRLSEFTAAIGVVQTERLEEIVAWKNRVARETLDAAHPDRLVLPEGMISGYYKYIVFSEIPKTTGRVYEQPCHRLMGHDVDLPNTDWVAQNHWCVPLYYHPDTDGQES